MKRRIIALLLIVVQLLAYSRISAPAFADKADTSRADAIRPLGITRSAKSIKAKNGIEQYGDYWVPNTFIKGDNLTSSPGLAYSINISDKTRFTGTLPAGFDQNELIEWGKYPGLNIDILHKHGFTGKGSVIAYIDQPFSSHQEYDREGVHYINNTDENDSMHGPAVLSLLTGKEIGTAPEAEVYYYAHEAWKGDQTTHAECLYQIIEQNKTLPEEKKIRMVGFSDNIDESEKNADVFRKAVKACKKAGVMVWFCGEYGAMSFIPLSDKNNPNNLVSERGDKFTPKLVFVPSAGRTTAGSFGSEYIYWSEGGLSWTMPYVLGLYAIAIEINPKLTEEDLRKAIVRTAYDKDDDKIINPVGFIASVLKGVGRKKEAQELLKEVNARTKYLYAIMDTVAMTPDDLTAVGDYLASITDAEVLVVDAAQFKDSQSIYTAMKSDAKKRGGTVTGVQIFGTPSMVPSFKIGYKVQMSTGVDDGGTLLTDLFYSNFKNKPGLLNKNYNVMDNMAGKRDVNLVPRWPVVRLPLNPGEYKAFFSNYNSFIKKTGLERLEIVNFSNPIFKSNDHTDDMGLFLKKRIDEEFHLMDVPYRLYGNLKGEYPVSHSVLGGFESKNMKAENKKGIYEFIINTHGQRDNIDNAIFVEGEEKRISTVNMKNINKVFAKNPYYLDAWTCLNGFGMENNLTTTALTGKCVGMFSATAIISNNGVHWDASLENMKKSNFYYFYYQYLKALYEGKTRSQAFFTAQQKYGKALIADSKEPVRGEGNYQFNLYNLLAYHNFGVIEPNAAGASLYNMKGYISKSKEGLQTEKQNQENMTKGKPIGKEKKLKFNVNSKELKSGKATIHSCTATLLDNGYTRHTIVYSVPRKMDIAIFNPPKNDLFMLQSSTGNMIDHGTLIFDIDKTALKKSEGITINFYINENDRYLVFIPVQVNQF